MSEIKLHPSSAECIVHCYNNLNGAREFASSLASDATVPAHLRSDFANISANITIATDRIDRRVPKQYTKDFDAQIKNNDPLKLQNILSIYARMLPEQQEMFELVGEAILKKEFTIENA